MDNGLIVPSGTLDAVVGSKLRKACPHHPHKVKEVLLWGTEDVNHRSDISETFQVKLTALRCHKSQVGHIPPEELEKRLRERHGSLAEGENFLLAEAFHRVEILW